MIPPSLALALAIVCALSAVLAAGGVARALARGDRDAAVADAVSALMGVAMAGMLEPRDAVIPAAVGGPLFALAAAWAILRAAPWRSDRRLMRPAHSTTHAVMCAAMVYMYAFEMGSGSMDPSNAPMSMMWMSKSIARPVATLALALTLAVVAAWRLAMAFRGVDAAHPSSGPGAMSAARAHYRLVDVVSAAAMSLVMAYALAASL